MPTVKLFEVLLYDINNSIQNQLNGCKYIKWLNSSIWLLDETLTGTTILDQSGPGSNGYEGVLHIPETSPSDCLVPYLEHSLGWSLTPLQR